LLFFHLFQQNAQLSDCFLIFSSARRFLDPNQRRKINAFEANAESFYLEGTRQQRLGAFAKTIFRRTTDAIGRADRVRKLSRTMEPDFQCRER
jgi:hypothetical protein